MYANYIKRLLDVLLSFFALLILSPIFLILILLVAVQMKGNPFFLQPRPGKNGKVFKIIKLRTMTNCCDSSGKLLPDTERQTRFGRILRSTSLDELTEIINILKGDMSIVGPRPLLVEYLPYYTEQEMHRHDVRPGLTGLAQVRGRNGLSWKLRFESDLEYVYNLSLRLDVKILFLTVRKVLTHEGVAEDTGAEEGNFADIRSAELQKIQ